jgi:hypothetical protein
MLESLNPPAAVAGDSVAALASLLRLLGVCVTEGACPGRAKAVFEQLRRLAREPDLDPQLREACWQLGLHWVGWQVRAAQDLRERWGEWPAPVDAAPH